MRIIRKSSNFNNIRKPIIRKAAKKNFSREFNEVWNAIVEHGIATGKECQLVCSINGWRKDSLNDIIFVRTGYHDIEQYLGENEEDEDDFACGSKGKKKFADDAMYMEPNSGEVAPYEDWWYDEIDEDGVYTGKKVNAVDLGEVFEVVKDKNGDWVEPENLAWQNTEIDRINSMFEDDDFACGSKGKKKLAH